MKYLNKLSSVLCTAALGLLVLTGCEGGDLYGVSSPDWISEKIDSIENAKKGDVEVLEGMEEDVYTVGATFDTITEALCAGDKVQLVGFGGFETKSREARMGRNPKTREAIEIPATTIPVFKAGKALKDKVAK